ncbi:MAG TPA: serine protease [Nitrospira sp.]|nr:serine protease [Nitrospira sp.]
MMGTNLEDIMLRTMATCFLSAAAAVSLSLFFHSAAADIVDVLPTVKPSIVGIGTVHPLRTPRIKLAGTGFVVADGHHVITNAHVPPAVMETEKGEALAILIPTADGIAARKAEKVAADPDHDLVILRFEGEALPPLKLGNSSQAKEGRLYYFTGYPIGTVLGLHPATHRAGLAAIAPVYSPPPATKNLTASLIKRADSSFDIFQLDATAFPGNSGSPLYDGDTGEVIGVINSVFVKGAKENILKDPSGIAYAIPTRYVQALFAQTGLWP